ncbi:TM0106 family RecB-like putative nuclease [Gordonia sp. TBRC 11910]|uniref:TM0106 family RecB-like putative nuclease n=1 Tax=Gordonia asplenii TaxID=2725283 RepID=A0A848L0A5_9ACTN|nr:TM0106 family RecB-like putative nuclease [Gordonia asplenii]NMO04390.1 TM0106 family RecB-like putative nuclease [Gordonia asplenii]
MSSPVLGARDLTGCEHRLALDFAPGRDTMPVEPVTDPDVAQRIRAATEHRGRVRDLLRSLHSDQPPGTFVIVDDAAPRRDRVEATDRACRDGARWIADAVLRTDVDAGRRGHSELLVHDGTGYVPVIVVNHRVSQPVTVDPDDRNRSGIVTSPLWGWLPATDQSRAARNNRRDQMRLLHLYRMLQAAGLAGREQGGVIGLDVDCIVVVDLEPMLPGYDDNLARRRRIAAQQIATVPSRVGECRGCPWWGQCEPELVDRRDVSLVVNGAQVKVLSDNGIHTIDQLADADQAPAEYVGSFDDAVTFAQCWITDTPLVRRHDDVAVRRADVEVDVDMESFGEDGAYLWGTLLTDNTIGQVEPYRPFVTWQPLPTVDEARSFAEFWQWLMTARNSARSQGKTFAAYCYSEQAENRWLRGSADRFAGYPGIPSRAKVDAFIASDEWVDIFAAVGRNFLSPKGKGLKRVAPIAGFRWRDDDAGGAASMDWYRHAVGIGETVDLTQRRRLLEYNEDDVRATKVLREWMDGAAASTIPTVDDVRRRYHDAAKLPGRV